MTYRNFTEEQISKANRISIIDLAKQYGYDIESINGRTVKIKGMGGLVIDTEKNCWHWFSQQIKGGGPIQFVMYFQKKSWKEAVTELIHEEGNYKVVDNIPKFSKENTKRNFRLPEQNSTFKHIFAYLIKTRKIDAKVVDYFVKEKILYENTKRSCVFVGKDKDGIARYANIRSTNTVGDPFKGEAAGSDKRFGFCKSGTSNTITVFEAPIDMLSYMTIFKLKGAYDVIKNDTLLCLGGVEDIALKQYLLDHKNINVIQGALDQDEAGNNGWEKICNKYFNYKLVRLTIPEKDWNQYLINHNASFKIEENNQNIAVKQKDDIDKSTKDFNYKYYSIDKNNQNQYVIKVLNSALDIISVSWPIESFDMAAIKLDQIIEQDNRNGIKAEKVPIQIMEKTRECLITEKENPRQYMIQDEQELEIEI